MRKTNKEQLKEQRAFLRSLSQKDRDYIANYGFDMWQKKQATEKILAERNAKATKLKTIEESAHRKVRVATALELLTKEGLEDFTKKHVEPLQQKLKTIEESQLAWRIEGNKFTEYVYRTFKSDLLKACEKEIDRIFSEKFNQLNQLDATIEESLDEMTVLTEELVKYLNKRLGKTENA